MVKPVSFKDKKEADLIEFIEGKDFSYYVKGLIREDMRKNKNKDNNPVKRKVDFGM